MPRGGYHAHAARWGRKSKWVSASATKSIRVPEELAEKILEIAHKLDEGFLDFDTKAKGDDSVSRGKEIEQLQAQVEKQKAELAEAEVLIQHLGKDNEQLQHVLWLVLNDIKVIASGGDPHRPHPAKKRPVHLRLLELGERLESWLRS